MLLRRYRDKRDEQQVFQPVVSSEEVEEVNFEEMTVEELTAYAEEHGIDIGKATSHSGIMQKILKAEEQQVED